MSEWISVKDKLPQESKPIIVYNKKTLQVVVAIRRYRKTKGWVWTRNNYMIKREYITHWMPLPEPPNET